MKTKYVKPKTKVVTADCESVFAAGSNSAKTFSVSYDKTTTTALSKESFLEDDADWDD